VVHLVHRHGGQLHAGGLAARCGARALGGGCCRGGGLFRRAACGVEGGKEGKTAADMSVPVSIRTMYCSEPYVPI
jgi:hypothetical protein